MANTGNINFGTGAAAFDPAYYLNKNPDLAAAFRGLHGNERNAAALRHFIAHGATELRNPSALFDSKAYVAAYPEVKGLNPLLHYRNHGIHEGRQAFAVQADAPRPLLGASPFAEEASFDLASLPQQEASPSFLSAQAPVDGTTGDPAGALPAVPQDGLLAHATLLADPAGFAFLPTEPAAATWHGALPPFAPRQEFGLGLGQAGGTDTLMLAGPEHAQAVLPA